jgi:hypothetical protein
MVLPTYLPYFFYVPFFGKFYVQSALFKRKIPFPFSVLHVDKTLQTETLIQVKSVLVRFFSWQIFSIFVLPSVGFEPTLLV